MIDLDKYLASFIFSSDSGSLKKYLKLNKKKWLGIGPEIDSFCWSYLFNWIKSSHISIKASDIRQTLLSVTKPNKLPLVSKIDFALLF